MIIWIDKRIRIYSYTLITNRKTLVVVCKKRSVQVAATKMFGHYLKNVRSTFYVTNKRSRNDVELVYMKYIGYRARGREGHESFFVLVS